MDINERNSEKTDLDFYRENIFQLLYNNISKIDNQVLSKKVYVALQTIRKLELIVDNNYDNMNQEFSDTLNNNLNEINQSEEVYDADLREYINEIIRIDEEVKANSKQKLSKIFRYIEEWVSIHDYSLSVNNEIILYKNTKLNKVFLSYAYDDKLYTLGLFFYFIAHNIFLYADWMHNNKIDDGKKLKLILEQELKSSNQLLFLDTISSQFQISGNWNIRQWCAWEIGCYNRLKALDGKFYLSIYKDTQTEKRLNNNLMLHDFNELHNIKMGILE